MQFCCLWHNVETSCHNHFIVVSRHQQTVSLTTSDKCHNLPWSGGDVLITPVAGWSIDSNRSIASYSLRIRISAYPTCIQLGGPQWNITMLFGMVKLQWLGYRRWKFFEDMFIHFYKIHECDRQTHRQTPHDSINCIASCGKNYNHCTAFQQKDWFLFLFIKEILHPPVLNNNLTQTSCTHPFLRSSPVAFVIIFKYILEKAYIPR